MGGGALPKEEEQTVNQKAIGAKSKAPWLLYFNERRLKRVGIREEGASRNGAR